MSEEKQTKIITKLAIASKGSLYAISLGVIALAAQHTLSPELAMVPQGIVIGGISSIIDRLQRGGSVTRGEIEEVVAKSGIKHMLETDEQTQSLIGRLFRRFDAVADISKENRDTLYNLLAHAEHYKYMITEIHCDLKHLKDTNERLSDLIQNLLTSYYPALSTTPKSTRPLSDLSLIGREDDLTWMHGNDGDFIIYGQPGCGKTFLFRKLVEMNNSLFAVQHNDPEKLAREIYARRPQCIIVDDAHVHLDAINTLRHIRETIDVSFQIAASCWPGDKETVLSKMMLTNGKSRELKRLSDKSIYAIVSETGLAGPSALIGEIIAQANGRPGLAVTLTELCRQDNCRDVLTGNAIGRHFKSILESTDMAILAHIALGGERGVKNELVARQIGISYETLRSRLASLAAAGVIDTKDGYTSVIPHTLRYPLVEQGIFSEPHFDLPYDYLESLNPTDLALTLLGCAFRDVEIPKDLVRDVVEASNPYSVIKYYAELGVDEANWAFQKYPDMVKRFALPFLHHLPEQTINVLLQHSIGHKGHINNNHPLRAVRDWLCEKGILLDEAKNRRLVLLTAVKDWLEQGNNVEVGMYGFYVAFSPLLHGSESDPLGESLKIYYGYVHEDIIDQLEILWPEFHQIVSIAEYRDWKHVFQLVSEWTFPEIKDGKQPSVGPKMRKIATNMIRDLETLANGHGGILSKLSYSAFHLDIQVQTDQDYDILYPAINLAIRGTADEDEAKSNVGNLAHQWITQQPTLVISRLEQVERWSQDVDSRYPTYTSLVCRKIAELVDNKTDWLQAAERSQLPDYLIDYFRD